MKDFWQASQLVHVMLYFLGEIFKYSSKGYYWSDKGDTCHSWEVRSRVCIQWSPAWIINWFTFKTLPLIALKSCFNLDVFIAKNPSSTWLLMLFSALTKTIWMSCSLDWRKLPTEECKILSSLRVLHSNRHSPMLEQNSNQSPLWSTDPLSKHQA